MCRGILSRGYAAASSENRKMDAANGSAPLSPAVQVHGCMADSKTDMYVRQ
jgi:hypothetical protein